MGSEGLVLIEQREPCLERLVRRSSGFDRVAAAEAIEDGFAVGWKLRARARQSRGPPPARSFLWISLSRRRGRHQACRIGCGRWPTRRAGTRRCRRSPGRRPSVRSSGRSKRALAVLTRATSASIARRTAASLEWRTSTCLTSRTCITLTFSACSSATRAAAGVVRLVPERSRFRPRPRRGPAFRRHVGFSRRRLADPEA